MPPSLIAAPAPDDDIVVLLRLAVAGHAGARSRVSTIVESVLHERIAVVARQSHLVESVHPSTLVDDVCRIFLHRGVREQASQDYLRRAASRAARTIICAHRRAESQEHSPDAKRLTLDAVVDEIEVYAGDIIRLDSALDSLGAQDPVMVEAIELRLFAAATSSDTARMLGLREREFERRWRAVKTWVAVETRV